MIQLRRSLIVPSCSTFSSKDSKLVHERHTLRPTLRRFEQVLEHPLNLLVIALFQPTQSTNALRLSFELSQLLCYDLRILLELGFLRVCSIVGLFCLPRSA